MNDLLHEYLPCLYAFWACFGFCFIFGVRKPLFIFLASLYGGIGWAVYLMTAAFGSGIAQYLLATIVVAVLSEVTARILKAPASIFLIIAIIPLVPGGGLYYTMDYLLDGNYAMFVQKGLHTAAYAGAIAVGVSMVSSVTRMVNWKRYEHHHHKSIC